MTTVLGKKCNQGSMGMQGKEMYFIIDVYTLDENPPQRTFDTYRLNGIS